MSPFHRVWAIGILVTALIVGGAFGATSTALVNQASGFAAVSAVPSGFNFPPNCTGQFNSFQSTPNLSIPTTVGVISDTITVVGVNPVLFNLTVNTNIAHTFNADLDITLTSPAGTVVTLSTDNGGTNANVFAGTTWDDAANPGGQIPYASNNRLVTDSFYSNNVAASVLVPEEPLAAFAGENPNGVWRLTISDDLNAEGGTLVSWALSLGTLTTAPSAVTTIQATNPVSQTISPSGIPLVSSTLTLTPTGFITRISVTTVLSHTFAGDIDMTLQAPNGRVVTLSTDNGAGNDNVFAGTIWDVDANPGGQVPYANNNGLVTDHQYVNNVLASPLTPEESLGAFWGDSPTGQWVLTIFDDTNLDGGVLNLWSLNVSTGACAVPPTPTVPATLTAIPTSTVIPPTTTVTPTTTAPTPTAAMPTTTVTPLLNKVYLPLILRSQ